MFSAVKVSFFLDLLSEERERKLLFPFNYLNVNLINTPLLFMAYFLLNRNTVIYKVIC